MKEQNHKSQSDESKFVVDLISVLKDSSAWCIEFGAGDGIEDCNVYDLINTHGHTGILIEPVKARYENLVTNYKNISHVYLRNSFVETSGLNSLDHILSEYGCPVSPDFISIDVDGNDLALWRAMQSFRPKIVCIEYNQTMAPWLEYEQAYDTARNIGSSAYSINAYASSNKYTLVHITKTNLIFLDNTYLESNMPTVNLVEGFLQFHSLTILSSSFDGEILLMGERENNIHGIGYKIAKFQVLPKILRIFPPNMNVVQKFFWRIWKLIKQPQRTIRQIIG